MKIAAVILLVVGIIGIVSGGFSFTTKEKVVDIGPIDVTRDKTHSQAIPMGLSIAAIAAGGALFFLGTRRTS